MFELPMNQRRALFVMCHNLGQAENGRRGGLYHGEADGGCDEREINKTRLITMMSKPDYVEAVLS